MSSTTITVYKRSGAYFNQIVQVTQIEPGQPITIVVPKDLLLVPKKQKIMTPNYSLLSTMECTVSDKEEENECSDYEEGFGPMKGARRPRGKSKKGMYRESSTDVMPPKKKIVHDISGGAGKSKRKKKVK